MQPLFDHNLLFLSVLIVSYLIRAVMEVSVEIRQRKRFRAGARRQDKGSYLVFDTMIRIGNALCVLLAFTVPASDASMALRDGLFQSLIP